MPHQHPKLKVVDEAFCSKAPSTGFTNKLSILILPALSWPLLHFLLELSMLNDLLDSKSDNKSQ